MKHFFRITSTFFVLACLLFSCVKPPKIDGFEIVIERIETETNAVSIAGSYIYPGSATIKSIWFSIDQRNDFINAEEYALHLDGTDFNFTIDGLEHNTLYYYRFVVDYGGETDHYT